MALNPDALLQHLKKLVNDRPLCIAYSGGVDSHVLLHFIATHQAEFSSVRAIYVDHQLQPASSTWATHCKQQAKQLNIPFDTLTVTVEGIEQSGVEAAARTSRYNALQEVLADNEVLLTAQHADDQAETVLLQLLRGAGPAGLAAMAEEGHWNGMPIIRPLLKSSRSDIEAYANTHQLQWIEDPSNAETDFDRNYLRHEVLPTLKSRWPAMSSTLSRSAEHCAEAGELMSNLAMIDAESVLDKTTQTLVISALLQLSLARQANLIRWAIMHKGLALPSTAVLEQLLSQLRLAADDAQLEISWADVVARRYQNHLYLDKKQSFSLTDLAVNHIDNVMLDETRTLHWQSASLGLRQSVVESGLTLRYRQGGEKIRQHGHAISKTLKHCFQEWQVPPWMRESVPLLFDGDTLVAVVGYAVAEGYVNADGEPGWWPSVRIEEAATF